MTGFDSESDRREAIRHQIVEECFFHIDHMIEMYGITHSHEEKLFLIMAVIERLSRSLRMDLRQAMMRQEIETAMQKIEGE